MYLWDAVVLLGSAWIATLYARRSFVAGIPQWRRWSFFAGLSGFAVLASGPLAHAALIDFQLHMVQHVGLMMLVSPAVVLGAPIRVWQAVRPLQVERWLQLTVVRALANPKLGFVLFGATLLSTHFSPLAALANRNTVAHQAVLVLFLFAGVVYYYPVLTGNPLPTPTPHGVRIGSLLLMMLPETMTGFFLYASSHPLHAGNPRLTDVDALHQQQAGGALMWAAAMAIDTVWIAVAVRDWLADEEATSDVQ